MPKIAVNIDAYVIPDDHLVFKCSPGKTYRFYLAVRDAKAVFPDIRGLDTLRGQPDQWTDREMLDVIAADRWARELRSRDRGNKEHGAEGISQIDRRTLTFLKRLYFEGKKGDLVVVPAEGYDKEILIGEFLTEPGDVRPFVARDGEYQGVYFGRPVRWRAFVQKLFLEPELIGALHSRAAVFVLKRSTAEHVYRLAYSNFVYRGIYVAEFRTSKEHFTAEDSAVVFTWLNGFDWARYELEKEGKLPTQMPFAAMGLERIPKGDATELRINIQSPGEVYLRSRTTFPLVLMAMFALAGCEAKQIIDDGVTVHLKTVGADDAGVRNEVEESLNATAVAFGDKRLEDANRHGDRAREGAQMSTRATLNSAPRRRN